MANKDGTSILYRVLENDLEYCLMTSRAECEAYVADLRRVNPLEDYSWETVRAGRRSGEEEMVWAGEAAVNLVTLELEQFVRVYTWKSKLLRLPPPDHQFLYWLMLFPTTDESRSAIDTRRIFKNILYVADGDGVVLRTGSRPSARS